MIYINHPHFKLVSIMYLSHSYMNRKLLFDFHLARSLCLDYSSKHCQKRAGFPVGKITVIQRNCTM